MTYEQFREYWLTKHVPLAKELSGLRRYRTAVPVDPERSQYDGIAELYFDTVAVFEAVLGRDSDTEAMRDVGSFERDNVRHLVTETVRFDDLGDAMRSYKVVAILDRDDDVSQATFVKRLAERAPPIERERGLRKYTTAVPVNPDEASYNAVVQLYFDDLSSLTAALGTDGTAVSVRYPADGSLVSRASNHVVKEIVQFDEIG